MNSYKKKLGVAGLVTAALTAFALVAPVSAYADSSVPPAVGSAAGQTDQALYVLDPETGAPLTPGSSVSYGLSVVGGPSATDPEAIIPAPAGGAGQAYTFIAPRGQERNYSAWNAQALLGSGTDQSLVAIGPSGQITPGTGSPSGTAAVANAGGDYSLGVAWVTNNVVLKTVFAYITVAPGNIASTTFTFSTPAAAAVAPVITTTSLNALTQNAAFTQTIAATGTAPITWAVQTGALPAGLSLNATTGEISGTPTAAGAYSFTLRATNGAGFDDQAFTGSVATPAPTAPTEPTGSAANKVTIANPAEGVTTVTVPAGVANANKTVKAWGWSDPTDLGQSTASAAGDVTVDVSTLAPGTHTIALTEAGDATFTVIAWGTVEIPVPSYPAKTDTVNLNAAVTASDLWSLNAEKTVVDFGNVQRDQSATQALGKVTVVDDRNVLKGWNLDAAWTKFTAGADEIPTSALTITPKAFTGYTLIPGITLGATANKIAQSDANISTLPAGALFDADLTFKAPKDAKVGQYHSTLTLTLASK